METKHPDGDASIDTEGTAIRCHEDRERDKVSSGGGYLLKPPSFSKNRVEPNGHLPFDKMKHPRIALFGSCDFYHKDSADLCYHIGRDIAHKLPNACILTGANSIAQERIARAFHDTVLESRQSCMEEGYCQEPLVFHLAPKGFSCNFDFGTCIEAGSSMEERRSILASSACVGISVEGGPGAVDEMNKTISAGNVVIPLARTGGASSGMFGAPSFVRPEYVKEGDWELLFDDTADIHESARATVSILDAVIRNRTDTIRARKQRKKVFQEVIGGALGTSVGPNIAGRPVVPDGFDYVEPALANHAHLVISADDLGKINGNVYLGPRSAAGIKALQGLVGANVAGIVNCTNRVPCYHKQSGIKYCQVAVNDEAAADILTFLEGATTFIQEILQSGGSVLVHCEMGVSRSATVVLAYLVRYHGMSRDEAYLAVRKRRPMVNPNPGFWKQLEAFETYCRNKNSKNVETDSPGQFEFDTEWATRSNALFATCRELPGVVEKAECFRQLSYAENLDAVLFVALDFIWGRGLLDVDVDWLACICRILDKTSAKVHAANRVKAMLTSDESKFNLIWAGEIYEDQIERVLAALQ